MSMTSMLDSGKVERYIKRIGMQMMHLGPILSADQVLDQVPPGDLLELSLSPRPNLYTSELNLLGLERGREWTRSGTCHVVRKSGG